MRLLTASSVALGLGLLLACGGGGTAAYDTGMPFDPQQLGAMSTDTGAPARGMRAPGAPGFGQAGAPMAMAGGDNISRGCQRATACGCPVDNCAESLASLTPEMWACILPLSCSEICGAGPTQCVQRSIQAQSAAQSQHHQMQMQIIGNMGGGENCYDGRDNDGDGAVDGADADCR